MAEKEFPEDIFDPLAEISKSLARIATAQERIVMVAMEAREERLKLAAQMKERLKAGFAQEKL